MRRYLFPLLFAVAAVLPGARAMAEPLNVPGTGDGIEMLRGLAAIFTSENPDIIVNVPPSIGSGGAIAGVGSGKEIIGRVARPLTGAELDQGLVYTPIARIPSVFVTHPGVGISNLTTKQLAGIYSGEVTNWNEVGGPDMRIKVVRREDKDSTLLVLRETMPGWKELALTPRSKTAVTTQDALDSVRDVEGAIGFGPYSTQMRAVMTVLSIDGRFPTDKGYPSAVELALIHKTGTVTPTAQKFIAFTRTEKAHQLIRNMGGVVVAD